MFRLRSSVLAVRGKPQTDKPQKFKVSHDFYRLSDRIGDHGVSMMVSRTDYSLSVGTGYLRCGAASAIQSVADAQRYDTLRALVWLLGKKCLQSTSSVLLCMRLIRCSCEHSVS